jgi:tetratricopeptide (TPR) repeat protein
VRGLSTTRARVAVAAVAGALLVVAAGAMLAPRGEKRETRDPVVPLAQSVTRPGPGQDLAAAITRTQERLRTLPRDWATWAELGSAYVQQARITGDPSYYAKAEGALKQSLKVQPTGNALAEAGLGALAAARHDFPAALRHGQAATKIDAYLASAHGVVGDALIELGRYDEAWAAIQRMVDARPDTASYTRASYAWELRGDTERARAALEQALAVAPTPADAGYALFYLGELAFNAGDLKTAAARYEEGSRRAADYVPLQAGRAKVLAAQGKRTEAVAAYRTLVARLPLSTYVAELGDLLAAGGDKAGAEQQYALVRAEQQLLARSGVSTDLELALFNADHGDAAAALAGARKAYVTRKSVHAADALAWALHVNGKNAEALPLARQAVRLGSRNAQFYYHLGTIEAALGQRAAARQHLDQALKINPFFSVRRSGDASTGLSRLGGPL